MNLKDPNALPVVRTTNGAQLPLRESPSVFAIENGDGTTENLWGVDIVRGRPVVYCGCRYPFDDRMWRDRWKETLRLKGRNQMSLIPGMLGFLSPGSGLWLQWPTACASDGEVPCYTVYLPETHWEVRLSERERARRAGIFPEWREPHVLIEGSRDDTVVVVSLLRLPSDATVGRIDGRPVLPIGCVSLGGKTCLHVVVEADSWQRVRERAESVRILMPNPESWCDDWNEDDMEGLWVTMGSDEVGFAELVRMLAVWTG